MAIERIVRPYETGNVAPPRLAPQSGQTKQADIVRLRIGLTSGQPGAKMLNFSVSSSTSFYVKHKQKEETT